MVQKSLAPDPPSHPSLMFQQDAHVVSPSNATHLLSLLQQRNHHSFDGRSSPDTAAADALCCSCRSITFHIYDPTSSPDILHLLRPSSNPTTEALDTTLLALSWDVTLGPSLCHSSEKSLMCIMHMPPEVSLVRLKLFSQHFSSPYNLTPARAQVLILHPNPM